MTNTRKLTLVAVLSALSFILMFYQFSFLIDFFKIDLSIIAILLALVLLDFKSAVWVTLIRSVLKLALNNKGLDRITNQYHWSSCFCPCFCLDLEQGTDPWSICPGNDCWNDQLEYHDGIGELCLCNPFVCSLYEL